MRMITQTPGLARGTRYPTNSLLRLDLKPLAKESEMVHTKDNQRPYRWLFAAALLLLSCAASAAGPGAVRKQIESSMRVTGTIEVSPDGSVRTYAIDHAEEIPKGLLAFIQQNVDQWKFDPVTVDGKAVGVRNKMSLRVVAKKLNDDEYDVRLQAASFDPFTVEAGRQITSKSMPPPRFPEEAAMSGAAGTAYLILKVGRDGNVEDVVTEQVNLHIVGTEGQMERWRNLFGKASMQAARKWQFIPPVLGEDAGEAYWTVRVPVDFKFSRKETKYGQWEAYVPGPRQKHPWSEDSGDGDSPEALAAGGVHTVGNGGLRLLTPLGQQG